MIFGKAEKRSQFWNEKGELIWKSAAPKTPLFARLLSQGDLQIHLPNEITKEKVM